MVLTFCNQKLQGRFASNRLGQLRTCHAGTRQPPVVFLVLSFKGPFWAWVFPSAENAGAELPELSVVATSAADCEKLRSLLVEKHQPAVFMSRFGGSKRVSCSFVFFFFWGRGGGGEFKGPRCFVVCLSFFFFFGGGGGEQF